MRNLKSFVAHHDPTIDILLRKPRSILYRPFSTFLWFTNYYLKGIKGFFKGGGSHSGLVRALGKRVRGNSLREFESLTLRNFSKRVSEPKIWSARSAVCSAFPPQNPDSARIRHAPRGSKSTVRSLI